MVRHAIRFTVPVKRDDNRSIRWQLVRLPGNVSLTNAAEQSVELCSIVVVELGQWLQDIHPAIAFLVRFVSERRWCWMENGVARALAYRFRQSKVITASISLIFDAATS